MSWNEGGMTNPRGIIIAQDFNKLEEKMAPNELRDALRQSPFEPFRLVMTDGVAFDIRHQDLLMVGLRTATVGLTGQPGQLFYERTVKVDLLHVVRIEPLASANPSSSNGMDSPTLPRVSKTGRNRPA